MISFEKLNKFSQYGYYHALQNPALASHLQALPQIF